MSFGSPSSRTIFAPAKINLFLHITGKRNDGYHELESLTAFADIGDIVTLQHGKTPSLSLYPEDNDTPRDNRNLVIRAINAATKALNTSPDYAIHLTKNIPMGAGLGGGSADAAAVVRSIMKQAGKPLPEKELASLLLSLGADVPVCYEGQASFIEGIGEKITPLKQFPKIPAILIYPNVHCATADIFKNFDSDNGFSAPVSCPNQFKTAGDLTLFLQEQRNDLTAAAIKHAPIIQETLDHISVQNGCRLSRMSGSGSCCFGLFDTEETAAEATKMIRDNHPDWWVQQTVIE